MLDIVMATQFRRDYKTIKKRGKSLHRLEQCITMLQAQHPLPVPYRDHALSGNWKGYRECHIEPDWLLIYAIQSANNTLELRRTGSHADLF